MVLMALVGALNNRRARKKSVQQAVAAGPRVLVHDINDDRCTGCDACVAVCPTNVLDLVNNKSRVLHFQDCIQCEACMWACPTEALVMFPEGAKPPPLKVPDIDADFQTRVPGQYLIGEVAGKPLVKNAANLGRAVVEHMLKNGLSAGSKRQAEGSDAKGATVVDVVIVGSGPGGLSAALTCVQRGLSYVILEKEQQIASTIARYPKGKLVMAEPYDTTNLSLLPVFDSSKEQIIPIWKDVIERTQLQVKLGEAVESVKRQENGPFDIRTTVGAYRAQRVVLATGTRGKPRTLQVPGENMPKVANLLDDPDDYRGKSVLVIGGGDSAVEAALALADAGAKVIISYRGKAFNRCAPKNKNAIESYAAENRLKVKLGSQVVEFEPESVILALADGSQKRYPNHAAFVLIGADPPIQWLEKLGVKFVEKPHQFSLGKTDEFVRRMVPDAVECPQDATAAAAQVRGEAIPAPARAAAAVALPEPEDRTGARKWLKSASAIFAQSSKKLDQPMPLSEFAKRQRTHSGQGRRDQLSPGERTRVLRMLRDVGGRIADEESQVSMLESEVSGIAQVPPDADLSPPPERRVERLPGIEPPMFLDDEPAPKQAVIVGLARAMSKGPATRSRRAGSPPQNTPPHGTPPGAQPAGAQARSKRSSVVPPLPADGPPPMRPDSPRVRSAAPPPGRGKRPNGSPSWQDEPTRQVGEDAAADLLRQVRGGAPTRRRPSAFDDEATRAVDMDASLVAASAADDDLLHRAVSAADGAIDLGPRRESVRFPKVEVADDPTAFSDVSDLVRHERARAPRPTPGKPPAPGRRMPPPPFSDEATRVADDAPPRSLTDIDWDLE